MIQRKSLARLRCLGMCIFALSFAACASYIRDPVRNRTLARTKVPLGLRLPNAVIFVRNPPTLEIVYFLAFRLPSSYIILDAFERRSQNPAEARPERTIDDVLFETRSVLSRMDHSGPTLRRRVRRDGRYLVFHQRRAVGFDRLPLEFLQNPRLDLEWAEEAPSGPSQSRAASMSRYEKYVSALINYQLGPISVLYHLTGPPLPWRHDPAAGENYIKLLVRADQEGASPYVERDSSRRGYFLGCTWSFLYSLTLGLYLPDSMEDWGEGTYSPGGYSDCLTQMFYSSEFKKFTRGLKPGAQIAADREKVFKEGMALLGYRLKFSSGEFYETPKIVVRYKSLDDKKMYDYLGSAQGHSWFRQR